MPPFELSRHTFTEGRINASGRFFLTGRIPYQYRQLSDNITVLAKQGDTLFSLAGRHFKPLLRPCGLWWVIADFQPQPIHDPTIQLAAGSAVIIPSTRTVEEEIFSPRRTYEALI